MIYARLSVCLFFCNSKHEGEIFLFPYSYCCYTLRAPCLWECLRMERTCCVVCCLVVVVVVSARLNIAYYYVRSTHVDFVLACVRAYIIRFVINAAKECLKYLKLMPEFQLRPSVLGSHSISARRSTHTWRLT